METRNLGRSGLKVSVVGLGCNNFGRRVDLAATKTVIHKALDLGVTLFDTADIYGVGESESFIGETLGDRRKEVVLATKFGIPMDDSGYHQGGSRRYIHYAVDQSLRRLKTDWIDLYQLHSYDPSTPLDETLRALDDLVTQGKVRYIGCSNVPAWEVAGAAWTSKTYGLEPFVSAQDEYSLLVRDVEKELIPAATRYGLGVLPYFPLASGLLTGKYKRGQPMPEGARLTNSQGMADRYMNEKNWGIVEGLGAFAESKGHTLLELAFSWLASQPVVSSVIAGATKPEQVEANVAAAWWKLSAEELAEVDKITGKSG